ncbi:Mbeg1-like protein [Mesobacillus subterraneus]|uniref:DUF2974 domain-containing protein n=1 Tax=Mesobacillus subterraneus TaxID=285983 RepID=A0A3R9KVE0_9BACI|nr:Mbeg1-like protein [Mesobacillus subterraneus]RSD27083.1 DUF2974 domain-containing protein [Mesobacillus subterraneus]
MSSTITENDHKILADLAYLDIPKNSQLERDYLDGKLTIGQLATYHSQRLETDTGSVKERFRSEEDYKQYQETVLSLTQSTSKYNDWKIDNYTNNNNSTGFVAYTFVPKQGEAVIAFRGSEAMDDPRHLNTDWDNNGTTLYKAETVQQAEAIQYLNKVGDKYSSLSVTGHSLGGNISLAGSLLANDDIRDKIWTVRTFNAPGFNREFINANDQRIAEMSGRIYEFQNEDDLVSSIMFNPTDPIIIETNMKTSDWKTRLLDPLLKLTDSHSLRHMSADEDGNLIRKEYQLKNPTNHFVANLTQGLQMLPNSMLGGFVDTTFAFINGRANLDGLMKGALVLTAISPVAALTVGMVTIKTVVTAAAIILLVTAAMTMRDYAFMAVEQFSKKVYEKVTETMDVLFARMVVEGVKLAISINEFKNMVKEQVSGFLSRTADALKSWWKSVSGGDSGVIEVNTGHLRSVAARLSSLQQRIDRVDSGLNSLRKLAQLDDKISIAMLDFRVGYDHELKNIINYLNHTASKVDELERTLSWKARGI